MDCGPAMMETITGPAEFNQASGGGLGIIAQQHAQPKVNLAQDLKKSESESR